jgi:hypothetical protein
MKVVSTNYTGVIPGIGKGPFTNKCISDQLFNTVRNLGYPVMITGVKAKPKVAIQNISQKVEKKPATKVEESIKAAEKIATETAKPVETPTTPAVASPAVEAPAPVAETPAEVKEEAKVETVTEAVKLSKEELQAKTVEELDDYLKAIAPDLQRPLRYGKPWLIKQITALS